MQTQWQSVGPDQTSFLKQLSEYLQSFWKVMKWEDLFLADPSQIKVSLLYMKALLS